MNQELENVACSLQVMYQKLKFKENMITNYIDERLKSIVNYLKSQIPTKKKKIY